jgi:hypothetical protein
MKITRKQLRTLIAEVTKQDTLSEAVVKYSGIVKMILPEELRELLTIEIEKLPNHAIPLDNINNIEKPLKDMPFHITLLHQSAFKDPSLKPHRKSLKKIAITEYNGTINFSPEVIYRQDPVLGRETWALFVDDLTQAQLETYVRELINSLAPGEADRILSQYDPGRKFHISLANLTGRPGDSVR